MNKLSIFSIVFGILFITNSALATVGGPTYISDIAFNVKDNSVYYKVHDGGGRGCPPIIHKISLTTQKDSEVKSCTQVEQEFSSNQEGAVDKYSQFMADIYKDLPYLGSVNLKKNNIDIGVEFLSEHVQSEYDFVDWSEFRATISQDNKKIGEINFRGCAKDQPHVFEGYMIPNSDAMAILISNKGDCFEGGYVKENLQVIKGIKYYDKNIVRDFKTASATEPNSGNAVVYAGVTQAPEPETILPEKTVAENKNNNNILYIVVIALGLGFGYFFGRKKKD